MATTENVLRLLAIRPAGAAPGPWRLDVYAGQDTETELATQVRRLNGRRAARREFAGLGREFDAGPRPIRAAGEAPLDLEPLAAWASDHGADPLATLDLDGAARALGSQDAASLVARSEFGDTQARLADTVVAESISGRVRTAAVTDELAGLLKLLLLLRRAAAGSMEAAEHLTLSAWLARTVLILPRLHRARPDVPGSAPEPEPQPDPVPARLAELERARTALRRAAAEPLGVLVERIREDVAPRPRDLDASATRVRIQALSHDRERRADSSRARLSPTALRRLGEAERETIERAGVDLTADEPTDVLNRLDAAITDLATAVPVPAGRRMLPMAGGVIDLKVVAELIGKLPPLLGLGAAGGCQLNAGVGDLLIIRQDLKAYELSDFAHVENVLAGELREREHRRLDLSEETRTEEEETATQKDRDLSSTERNEMQSEMERTVESEFGIEAGLQVSGSYGPAVSFSSSLNASFTSSSEESQRRAASYSREVTERTAERVSERVRKEVQRRVLSQVEELNRHRIDNAGAGAEHVRGIYRWLTKVYDAQVFDYGQRMMLEFVVPEPAAWFMYAMTQATPKGKELRKPDPPTVAGRALKPDMLDLATAQSLIAAYEVLDAPPYPPSSVVVSHFDGADATGTSMSIGRGNKIPLPAGYTCSRARISVANAGAALDSFFVFVGGRDYVPLYDGLTGVVTFKEAYAGEVSVSIYGPSTAFFVLGLDLFCVLSDDGRRKWQQETFDAIVRAYQAQLADYEEQLAALEIQQGIQILGRNPLENRRLERDELKKIAVMILTDDTDPSLDGYTGAAEPEIDLDAACSSGVRVRFFENALEWSNMTYVLYPYFWGRRARWESAVALSDPDPEFAAFLKAGAARVQVPVRTGFEKAVAYFLQSGVIWNGADPPLVGDDLYVPIVEEIAESLDRPQAMRPYPADGEPWEVRVPTSLVLLQDVEEIPGIVDTLTGAETDLDGPDQ